MTIQKNSTIKQFQTNGRKEISVLSHGARTRKRV